MKPGGKGKGQGKNPGKGKQGGGNGLASLSEEAPGTSSAAEGIALSCLTRASDCATYPMLNAVSNKSDSEQWGEYVKVEVAIDSGAAECVCGLDPPERASRRARLSQQACNTFARMVGGSRTWGSRTPKA